MTINVIEISETTIPEIAWGRDTQTGVFHVSMDFSDDPWAKERENEELDNEEY